ncbi:hypothetical protein LO762_10495 [Actinocorallia sp. API 0066]|uniref:hypothetical protein n=1 Tax=Actinocorallia sp. API 0066 TaxID=2896846 RepID=UPI001E319C5D|nr:hypothetical protein [Actinocorallia sp. API 0066]MCD0449616.1 hypothetical protein [Actinocorallia sp. API 0066]
MKRLGLTGPFTTTDFAALPTLADLTERAITVDQTNRSVVVGERLVVKWFTPPAPPPQRGLEVLRQLAEAGFTETARPYTAVFDGAGALLALVMDYLPDALDGWDWCVDAAVAGEPVGALLGGLVADLHAALATPTASMPEPLTVGVPAGLHARALAALEEARSLTGEDWPSSWTSRLRAAFEPLASPGETVLMRVHGDLHVGQVLRWRDGHAVIDFDGNPVVAPDGGIGHPVARDVAQFLMSLEHVGQVASYRRGHDASAWVRDAVRDFRAAYTARLASLGKAEIFDERLVAPFAAEQECRELVYAARFLPRWRYAPMGVLRSWFSEGD